MNRCIPNNSATVNGERVHAPRAGAITSSAVPSGHIFGFIIFLMFCLPNKQLSRFPLLGVQTDFTEFFALVLPLVYLLFYRRQVAPAPLSRRSQALFLLFVASLGFAACVFITLFGFDTLSPFIIRNLRIVSPFLSAGLVGIQGIKISRLVFLRWFCMALLTSYVVLMVTYVTGYQRVTDYEGFENVSQSVLGGRFANQNWQFATVGICVLLDPLKRAFCKTVFDHWLVTIVCILSIIQLILGFNRTFLAMSVVELLLIQVYVARAAFSVVLKTILVIVTAIGTLIAAYHISDDVQLQIDRRLLIFTDNAEQAMSDAWNPWLSRASRGAILEASIDHLKNSWLVGIKPGEPILVANLARGEREVYLVDTAFFAVWLRFGLLPTIMFGLFWLSAIGDMLREGADSRRDVYSRNYAKGTAVILATFVLASSNTSSLTFHNAVFFGMLFPFFWRDSIDRPGWATSRQGGS